MSLSVNRLLLFLVCALAYVALGTDLRSAQEVAGPENPEPVVTSIQVIGNSRYRSESLIEALGQPIGEPIDEAAIERGLRRLFDAFRVRGNVGYALEEGHLDRMQLLLEVEELALDLEVRFLGNDAVDEEELRRWGHVTEDGQLYLYQGQRVRERILRGYKEKGYAFAAVDLVERAAHVDPETGQSIPADIIFNIIEGPRVKVRDVVVHGSETMPDGGWGLFRYGLLKLAGNKLKSPRFFGLFKSKFNRDELEADLVAMRTVYRERGYLNAVVELQELEYNAERDRVTIHVAVDEGPLYHVRSIGIEGADWIVDRSTREGGRFEPAELYFDEADLLKLLQLKPGAPYDTPSRRADRLTLASYYGSRGFIDHSSMPTADRYRFLDPTIVYDESEPLIDVTYRLAQGKKQRIGEISVHGNKYTRDRVIRDRIDLDPGGVADLDVIRRARNRIEGTGFFSDPFNVIEHRQPEFRFIGTDDPGVKDLEFQVEEGSGLNFGINGGITSTGGAFGSINITKENFDITRPPSSIFNVIDEVSSLRAFHGAGQTLRLQAAPGTRFSTYELMFYEPDLFGRHRNAISLRVSARRRFRSFSSHDEERDEITARVGYALDADTTVFLGYTYGNVDVSDLSEGVEPSLSDPLSVTATLKAQEGSSDLGHLMLGYRKNTIDNRINPKNGVSFGATSKLYLAATGSDFDFVTTDLTFDYYDEFGIEDGSASDRWHFGARLGVAAPLDEDTFIPYTERYFLGGRIMRGFNFRGIGPFDKGEPEGGETFFYTTLEYRHPLVSTTQPGTYREIETLQGGFFIDAGILDPDEWSLDTDSLRVSAGILFGISVPLPITFSFGWPLISEPGDERQVLDFNIGL